MRGLQICKKIRESSRVQRNLGLIDAFFLPWLAAMLPRSSEIRGSDLLAENLRRFS